MVRLRNEATGAVVNVSEERASRLPGFVPVDAEKKPVRRRKADEKPADEK